MPTSACRLPAPLFIRASAVAQQGRKSFQVSGCHRRINLPRAVIPRNQPRRGTRQGSFETRGFKRRSLVTFCRCWQKVTLRSKNLRRAEQSASYQPFPPGAYFCHQRQKYAKAPLKTYGFKNSLSAFRAEGTCITSPHARGNCHVDHSHIEWLSASPIAAAPVLLIATAGTTVHQNGRGSATRTVILTNYENLPPQYRHASGNFE